MKQLIILSAVLFLSATSKAQTDVSTIKKNETSLKKEVSTIKKEIRKERKELRKIKSSEVSDRTKQSFFNDFGNIPGTKWERTSDNSFDKAIFVSDGKNMEAYYDYDANRVATVQHKTFADLPAKAQKTILTKYKDYTVDDVIFMDDNELNETDMIFYGVQFDDADNFFVDLTKDGKTTVYQVNMAGNVSYFKAIGNGAKKR